MPLRCPWCCLPRPSASAHPKVRLVCALIQLSKLRHLLAPLLPYPAPEECFSDDPIKACKTCCCKSDDRVTFYDKYVPEPCCKAKSVASYTVRFVGTWSPECHPDYYTEEAKWSEFVAASHKGGVRLWDHCFDKVTPGMQRLAEQGKGNLLEEELDDLISNGKAYDQVKGPPISDGRLGISVHAFCARQPLYVSWCVHAPAA